MLAAQLHIGDAFNHPEFGNCIRVPLSECPEHSNHTRYHVVWDIGAQLETGAFRRIPETARVVPLPHGSVHIVPPEVRPAIKQFGADFIPTRPRLSTPDHETTRLMAVVNRIKHVT